MKITIQFDLNDEGDAQAFDTHRMSAHTRAACAAALEHIRKRLKYGGIELPVCEELEAVRAVLLEELDGREP